MELVFKYIHSVWAVLVLVAVIAATINALRGALGEQRPYLPKDFKLALSALILTHLQFVIGLVLYFLSGKILWFSGISASEIMKNSELRLYNVEHPTVMLIAIAFLTIGYSKHKKKRTSQQKLKTLAIFYSIALLCMLSRVPWSQWLGTWSDLF